MGSRPGIFPSLAVVIEWENAVLAKLSRTMRMLEQLRQQLTEIAPLIAGSFASSCPFEFTSR